MLKSSGSLHKIIFSFFFPQHRNFYHLEVFIFDFNFFSQRPDGTFIQPIIADNGDGTFTVTYTPEDVGVYTIKIKFGGVDVPNTPIKAQSKPVGDASKCRITSKIICNIYNKISNFKYLLVYCRTLKIEVMKNFN